MSLAIEPELEEKLKVFAKKQGVSASAFVRDVVTQHISEENMKCIVFKIPDDGSITPVVLKIPSELKLNFEDLEKWLDSQSKAILKKISETQEIV